MRFDPFNSRECRDARNRSAHGFVKAIIAKDPGPFEKVAKPYQTGKKPEYVNDYIRQRAAKLTIVIEQINETGVLVSDCFAVARILWNQGLFFEFHEVLEEEWMKAGGNRKKAIQALILAAVVYEHLTYGRKEPAKKAAKRAVDLMIHYRNIVPGPFDPNVFIEKLSQVDPVPPEF